MKRYQRLIPPQKNGGESHFAGGFALLSLNTLQTVFRQSESIANPPSPVRIRAAPLGAGSRRDWLALLIS